ncbi:hypothetical protein QQZ08_011339 [Neonectria magnoliae]|uniref:Aminoglycoside phosphotransferase domain-containing protein n=1 Tax=Neonectria magnoliae TaxID=2732573 RepID=A0ABR1HCB8_9HYPO
MASPAADFASVKDGRRGGSVLRGMRELSAQLAHDKLTDDQRGSFNWSCQFIFTNGEKWMVRFPRGGKVKHPDEKVEIEVATMNLMREYTDVPVPEVKARGVSSDNELGIGPFIEGMSLGDILQDLDDPDSRWMRQNMSHANIKPIYRQIARFKLQLSKLRFSPIGS